MARIKYMVASNRRLLFWLAGALAVLVCLRLALPCALKAYVNRQLNRSHDYRGHIGDVTVHLWRGAYQIHGINILKANGQVPSPFFSAQLMDLSLEWNELFRGAIVSEIRMVEPRLNFVSGPTAEQSQSGKENNWNDTLESLVPFKINSFSITNGQVHFQNPYSNPPVDIYLTDVFAVATNFTNARGATNALPAGVTAIGHALGNGSLFFEIHVDPLAKSPTFELTGQLTNVNLVDLNNFLRAYGKFDVARGNFALFSSFAAKDGAYDGYAKVLIRNLQVFKWQKERKKNALAIFWEAIVGTLTEAFRNQPHDQLATRVPITGQFGKTDVHVWSTVTMLLRNAFVRALVPKMDEPVKVEQAEQVKKYGQEVNTNRISTTNQPGKGGQRPGNRR